jgi:glycosyltransferase involved in cell wall biosynthesis
VSKSKGIVKRLLNYFSFVWSSFWIGRSKLESEYDFIFCESPPLFLGISAFFLCKSKKAKLIFNVSDLWPESAEKLGLVTNKVMLKSATWLEEFLYKKSVLVTGQTQGIVKDISSRFPNKKVYWLPNGVDLNLYNPQAVSSNWRKENGFGDNDLLLLYAGIIGHAQGLELLIHAFDKLKHLPEVKMLMLGSGPEKDKLIALKSQLKVDNVIFLDLVTKKEMPQIIKASDVAVVPLKKLDLFKGAIPSKIFENLAMEKALLLGVDGEARKLFIDEGQAGLYFEPENVDDLVSQIKQLEDNRAIIEVYGKSGRSYVTEKFNRDNLARGFYEELKQL